MKKVLFLAAALLLPISAHADQWARDATYHLILNETVQQATTAINGFISLDQVRICGENTSGGPWICREIVYQDNSGYLRLYFSWDGNLWHLANWTFQ